MIGDVLAPDNLGTLDMSGWLIVPHFGAAVINLRFSSDESGVT
jgi:hypothetical protein